MEGYALLDSGGGRKLERFGPYIMDRPAARVLWKRRRPELWEKADARFERVGDGDGNWSQQPGLPARWTARIAGVSFHIAPTPFGHLPREDRLRTPDGTPLQGFPPGADAPPRACGPGSG